MTDNSSKPVDSRQTQNQGEGDHVSADRYNNMQRKFVESPQGKQIIENAEELNAEEQREVEEAEELGRARAKDEDPAVTRHHDSDNSAP